MKAVSLVAFFVSLLSFTSCDCKQELATLQKENDSLKLALKECSGSKSNWYTPDYFKGIKKVGGDYTDYMGLNDANKMILAYQKKHIGEQNYSFTLSADSIRNYLVNYPNVHDLQIFNALEGVQSTVIAIGADAEGKHIYMKDKYGHLVVFEHCQPCPTCNTSFPEANHAQIRGRDATHNYDTLEYMTLDTPLP